MRLNMRRIIHIYNMYRYIIIVIFIKVKVYLNAFIQLSVIVIVCIPDNYIIKIALIAIKNSFKLILICIINRFCDFAHKTNNCELTILIFL